MDMLTEPEDSLWLAFHGPELIPYPQGVGVASEYVGDSSQLDVWGCGGNWRYCRASHKKDRMMLVLSKILSVAQAGRAILKQRKPQHVEALRLVFSRAERIRTSDLLTPSQAR